MMVYTCGDSVEAMFTCIYDAWVWAASHGHDQIRLEREPIFQQTFFDEYHHVEADAEKAEKVSRSIQKKISREAYICVYYACLYEKDSLDDIYRYLRVAFRVGEGVQNMLTDPAVMRMMEIRRKVGNEIHYFREFLRFQSVNDQVYVSHFEPKSNVSYQVAIHFADRMPSEYWLIIDDTRRLAVVHPADEDMYLRRLNEEEFSRLQETEKIRDTFTNLWITFFDTIGIKERENAKCQRNMMPLWMRKHATEFIAR